MKSRILLGLLSLSLASAMAFAQSAAVVDTRQQAMKTMGGSLRTISQMLRGTTPFNEATATAALNAVVETSQRLPTLFPEGSLASHSKATGDVWSNNAEFRRLASELNEKAKVAVQAAPKGAESLRSAFGAIPSTCGSCHEKFAPSVQ